MENQEAKKDEVLKKPEEYILRRCQVSKYDLHTEDKEVRSFNVFRNNARVYAAYVCIMVEWGKAHHTCGGWDPIPVLLGWITTYIRIKKDLQTNADLLKKRVLVGAQ